MNRVIFRYKKIIYNKIKNRKIENYISNIIKFKILFNSNFQNLKWKILVNKMKKIK